MTSRLKPNSDGNGLVYLALKVKICCECLLGRKEIVALGTGSTRRREVISKREIRCSDTYITYIDGAKLTWLVWRGTLLFSA